ncbi:hypothetical protein [Fibrobacter sp. UWB10]|uniref:hypothetical protein n=1 Tax=Fibrobacter sp. UWB10 TaxID=1896201 RepID=UPI00240391B3|nr:hypothetical protein [Fibrobacter sp. UWB10]SMP44767.1 hypothetical protein SAMN05720465_0979 [Fibrobacter sp. UWB10]
MNIRKHWKKVLLSSTAFFWASCGGDSESVSAAGGTTNEAPATLIPDSNSTIDDGGMVALYGVQAVIDLDSGAISSSDSCDGDCTVPASSEDAAVSSSSESAEPSSSQSADKKLRLASDTTITCVHTLDNDGGRCLDAEDHQKSVNAIKKQLAENQTLTLEQLRELEDENEDPSMDMEVCLYGVFSTSCTHVSSPSPIYKCSNGNIYSYNTVYSLQHDDDPDKGGLIEGEGKLLYTPKEYKEKYPEKFLSSSSEEPSSSNSAPPPSPLCQKDDFATYGDMEKVFVKDRNDLVDSTKIAAGDNLSESESLCLSDIRISTSYASVEILPKKQICDGDTTVNPTYQERIDKHKEFIRKQIKECLDEEN